MDRNSINIFIKKNLDYYDNINTTYKDRINEDKITFDYNDKTISFGKLLMKYQVLGVMDNINNIWFWGWLLPELNIEEYKYALDLHLYGLKLDKQSSTSIYEFIKFLLCSGRILVKNSIELDVNLAIMSYLLQDKCKFIYPYKHYNKNECYMTVYYLLL